MSFTYGFFNSLNHDRRYSAEQLSDMFSGVIRDGVFVSVGDHYAVRPSGGMNITIGTGRSWFNGIWAVNDTEYPLEISASELVLDRIDAVVIEINKTQEERAAFFKIIKGTPSTYPDKPELINDDDVYQHPLAYIVVKKQVTSIREADIEIVVGKSECPFVTSILETTDIDALWDQWSDTWNAWFEDKKQSVNTSTAEFETSSRQAFNSWFTSVKTILEQEPTGAVLSRLAEVENLIKNSNVYSLNAGMWVESEGTNVYTQTITVPGVTSNTMLDYDFVPPDEFTEENVKRYVKHAGFIKKYRTAANSITFFCIRKIPEVDLKIRIRGY